MKLLSQCFLTGFVKHLGTPMCVDDSQWNG